MSVIMQIEGVFSFSEHSLSWSDQIRSDVINCCDTMTNG